VANGNFVAYYRVSTAKQGASGLGLDAQRDAVLGYLNGGNWNLLADFTDVETGTRKGNDRPQFKAAKAYAKKHGATLVIAKLDRLARNVAFIAELMEGCFDFVAVDMPTANKLTIHILAAVAEEEARMISARTKAALAAAKSRGVKLGKPENLTAEAQLKSAAANRAKAIATYAKITPMILALHGKGMSFRAIAGHLNDLGEVTATGQAFQAMTVKRLVDRAIVAAM